MFHIAFAYFPKVSASERFETNEMESNPPEAMPLVLSQGRTNHAKSIPPHAILHMVARYTGAWQEYSQRITARHQIISLWFGGSTGLMLFFAREDLGVGLANAVAIAMPMLSAAMFSMLLLHDLIMQRLTGYMRACESFNNDGPDALPSYRADDRFQHGFIRVRSLQNTVLTLTSLALWIGTFLLDGGRRVPHLQTWANVLIGIIWVAAILVNMGGIVFRGWKEYRAKQDGEIGASQ